MKKRLSDFIAGFLIVAQLFSGGVGIASVKAETSEESENTSLTAACSDGADNDGVGAIRLSVEAFPLIIL